MARGESALKVVQLLALSSAGFCLMARLFLAVLMAVLRVRRFIPVQNILTKESKPPAATSRCGGHTDGFGKMYVSKVKFELLDLFIWYHLKHLWGLPPILH